jgi:Zn-dependent protease with chaperone function
MDEPIYDYYNVFTLLQSSFEDLFIMHKKTLFNLTGLALLALILASCLKPTSNYPTLEKSEIEAERKKEQEDADREKARKEQAAKEQTAEFEARLHEVGGRIQDGGRQLCRHMMQVKNDCMFDFYLEKAKGTNAFADGKKIHVTEPMMKFAKEDEELAIVLGHEYAHNIMGHTAIKKTHAVIGAIVGFAADLAIESQGIPTDSGFLKAGTQAGAASFSKEYEKEADYIGLYIAALAGYKTGNAPSFWRKMAIKNPQSIFIGTTHPTSPERYLALERTATEIARKQQNGAVLTPDFKD